MIPLPSKEAAATILPLDNPTALALYDSVVLPAEQAANEKAATDEATAPFRAMFARVVGYLLLYPPSDQARAVVQGEIESCQDHERDPNEAIYDLGEMYVMDFILPFCKSAREPLLATRQLFVQVGPPHACTDAKIEDRTPRPSPPVSRDSFQSIKEDAYRCASQGGVNRPRDNLEAQALVRFLNARLLRE